MGLPDVGKSTYYVFFMTRWIFSDMCQRINERRAVQESMGERVAREAEPGQYAIHVPVLLRRCSSSRLSA
jgi:hypothetical protein